MDLTIFSLAYPGVATLWEAGGLSDLAAAVPVGALVAVLLRSADIVEEGTAADPLRLRPAPTTPFASPHPRTACLKRLRPLAGHPAGRGPPTLSL